MDLTSAFKPFLLALTLAHLLSWTFGVLSEFSESHDLLLANGMPVAGDFINVYAAGQLALARDLATIYDPEAFMAYERNIIPQPTGLRLWAYPPHSLLIVWPFGLLGFYAGLVLWSLLGLLLLGVGARRLGFNWSETAIVLLSPAALQCIYFGQSGNFFTGLLLLALSTRKPAAPISAICAAMLTMKPQTGFLLPLLWLIQVRWRLIALTSGLVACLVALAVALFGIDPWRDYLGLTLPMLSELGRYGTGAFMHMMPSVFMALRLLGVSGDAALYIHLGFAGLVVIVLAVALRQSSDPLAQSAMLLLGTALVTPYLHSYDLATVVCGALLVARRLDTLPSTTRRIALLFPIVLAWGLPNIVLRFNLMSIPVSPLILMAVFATAVALSPRHNGGVSPLSRPPYSR